MKIYLASGNLNKKREMSEIFSEHTIVIPKEEGIDFNPEETGTDFYQNSMIKARALWDIVHCPVIADDSGICVDALKGVPGVWSARYAGPDFHQGKPDGSKISQDEQNRLLIEELNEDIEINDNSASVLSELSNIGEDISEAERIVENRSTTLNKIKNKIEDMKNKL